MSRSTVFEHKGISNSDLQMKKDIAVVIEPSGNTSGLLRTLESVARQSTRYTIEVLINVGIDCDRVAPLVEELLSDNPWFFYTRAVQLNQPEPEKQLLELSKADYFIFLNCQDELLPGALENLVQSAQVHGSLVTLGWIRWTRATTAWSHPLISKFSNHSDSLWSSSELQIAISNAFSPLYSRAYYGSDRVKIQQSVSVVHDYTCRKFHDGNSHDNYLHIAQSDLLNTQTHLKASLMPPPIISDPKCKTGAWLFGERRGNAAEDNAFALFEYCLEKRPDIDAYYVLNQEAPDLASFPWKNKLLIKGTREYRLQLRVAGHFLFTDSAFDILESNDLVMEYSHVNHIYLTHGYLAYSPGVYQQRLQYIDAVVCTSHEDVMAASAAWGFPVSKFLRSGLARWDKLASHSASPREILLCPTWRKSLNSSFWKGEGQPSADDIEHFQQGEYFKAISSLLSSEQLLNVLRSHNLRLKIALHFRLNRYLYLFKKIESDLITVAYSGTLPALLQDAALLITDYSSIMWDMAYMEKPVICYQFDKAEILSERQKESFSLADDALPFTITFNQEDTISALEEYATKSFQLAEHEQLLLDNFIPSRNGGNCERTLNLLTKDGTDGAVHLQDISSRSDTFSLAVRPAGQIIRDRTGTTNIGVISGHSYEQYQGIKILSPENWREEVARENFQEVVVEPHVNAKSDWGEIFFDPKATRDLLREIAEYSQKYVPKLTLSLPEILPYRGILESLSHQFTTVLEASYQPYPVTEACEISVIVPVYNGEKHISRCLQSIVGQSIDRPIEIIAINDGSTDSTASILENLEKNHPNLLVLHRDNARQGMARNIGMLAARGRYVTFVDADDVLHHDALAALWHSSQLHGTKVSAGLVASCQEDGINQRVNQSYFHYSKAPDVISASSWPHLFYDPSSVAKLYDRNYLLANHIFFPQSFHEDQAFCFHLYARDEPIAVCRDIVYFYIARPTDDLKSGTQTFSYEKLQQILLAGKLAASHVDESLLHDKVKYYAMGFLVMRYDRFIWKLAQQVSADQLHTVLDLVMQSLQSFLLTLADEVIITHARHYDMYFLMVKRGEHQAARDVLSGNNRSAITLLSSQNALTPELIQALASGESLASTYNYYRAVRLANTINEGSLVTEESYGYRLGHIFVAAAKRPVDALYIPIRLLLLLVDIITRRGRVKELRAKERLLQSSEQALLNHSDFIKSTAAYQLGVALLEAITNAPDSSVKLPARIKSIYRNTKPTQ